MSHVGRQHHLTHLCGVSQHTWGLGDGQVSEVAALDDLHRQSPRCGAVGEAQQQLRNATVGQRLGGQGGVGEGALLGARRLDHRRTHED